MWWRTDSTPILTFSPCAEHTLRLGESGLGGRENCSTFALKNGVCVSALTGCWDRGTLGDIQPDWGRKGDGGGESRNRVWGGGGPGGVREWGDTMSW